MDWDKLRCSTRWRRPAASRTPASTLNLSQSAVSRQISALEEALQVPLFHRHARGLILTEQGESLNRTVREVFAKLAMTEALLTESKEKPAGRLKMTTTMAFRFYLAGAAAARLPGDVSGRIDIAAAGRRGARSGDARGRCGDPHASAEAARPGAAASADAAMAYLRLARISEAARCAAAAGGSGCPPADAVRQPPPASARHQLAGGGRTAAGQPASRIAGGEQRAAVLLAIRSGLGIGALPDFGRGEPRPRPNPARPEGAEGRRVLRVPRGIAELETSGGIPRFPARASKSAFPSSRSAGTVGRRDTGRPCSRSRIPLPDRTCRACW